MTQKDFVLIAEVIRNLTTSDDGTSVEVAGLVEDFANRLSDTNPKFDRKRFVNACK
jgi:hypothetical protein